MLRASEGVDPNGGVTAIPFLCTHRRSARAGRPSPSRGGVTEKGYPFEVHLPQGLGVEGVILSDKIKSLDWRVRKARRIGNVPAGVPHETVGKILALVDPDVAR
jgi:mRNA-degrading endonuclease toxin of MazEF toxin-antitoxin module